MGFTDLLEEVSEASSSAVIVGPIQVCKIELLLSACHGKVGGFGRYQWIHVTLISLPGLMMASQNLLNNFVSGVPTHHCNPVTNQSLDDLAFSFQVT